MVVASNVHEGTVEIEIPRTRVICIYLYIHVHISAEKCVAPSLRTSATYCVGVAERRSQIDPLPKGLLGNGFGYALTRTTEKLNMLSKGSCLFQNNIRKAINCNTRRRQRRA